ncbi:MAG: exosortase A [Burkholderiaceae bacterium]
MLAESRLPMLTLAPPWTRVVSALVLVLAAVLVAYRDTALAMVAIWWRSDTFAHAFLVPPIVLWLIWRRRHDLASVQPRPCPWMLLPMAGLGLLWLLGDLASVNSVTQLAMTGLLVLAVPAVLGIGVTRVILFPLAFLFFAVPIGEFLLPQLMAWTADFTVLALRASGIPVFREGMQFVIPSGQWSVVEACSGVRYLIASFMVGTLFAYLNYRSLARRWAFIAVSIVVPIVANWVRAYLIVLLGHVSGNQLAIGADHLIYGWVFFGLVIGLMFTIGSLWSEPEEAASPRPELQSGSGAPHRPQRRVMGVWPVAALAAAVVFVPHIALRTLGSVDDTGELQLSRPVALADGWQSAATPLADWKPAYQNPSAELASSYSRNGREVGVYIGYYRGQSYDRKLVSSANQLVTSEDAVWSQTGPADSFSLRTPGQEALAVRTAVLRGAPHSGLPEQRLSVWQVYWVGDRLTASDRWAKVFAVMDRLRGRGDDSAVIVLYATRNSTHDEAAVLESFAQSNLDAIVALLRRARDGAHARVATLPLTPRGAIE